MNTKQHSADRASHWAASGVSILNGIVGDYLHRRQNGLAIDMAFMHRGKPLTLDRDSLLAAYPQASGKICILIHGLCCSERSWLISDEADNTEEISYGSLLQTELGYTPLFVRYNSGRPLADNGEQFARLLGDLVSAYPVAVEEIVLIGHSMGGLIIRSACEFASQHANRQETARDAAWLTHVGKAFYLGTPHEGADLEKLTHAAVAVLDAVPNPITRVIGDVLNMRSQGIKNLRDSQALRPKAADALSSTPWLDRIQHYLIAGTLHEDPQHAVSQLFGDGLVRVPGAAAQGSVGYSMLPEEHIKVFPGVHHMALAHDRAVYAQIKDWLSQGRSK